MRVAIHFVVGLLTFSAVGVDAQEVRPGATVRISTASDSSRILGTLLRGTGKAIIIGRRDENEIELRWRDVARAEYHGRKPGVPYALAGGLFTAAATAITLNILAKRGCTGPECQNFSAFGIIALGSYVTGAIGAAVGYLVRPSGWREFSAADVVQAR